MKKHGQGRKPVKRLAHRRPKGQRKNPAHGLPGLDTLLANSVGTMSVTAALIGATLNEKLLIATLIPTALNIIRRIPNPKLDDVIDRLYPDPENAQPTEAEAPAGGKEKA